MHLNALRHRPKLDFFNSDMHQVFFFFYRFPWKRSFLFPPRLLLYLFAILKPYVCQASTRVGLGWFVLERSVFTGSSFTGPHTLWPPYIRHADPRHWMHHCQPLPPVVSMHSCAHILFPKTLSLQLACSLRILEPHIWSKPHFLHINGIFRATCEAQEPSNCRKLKTWTYQWATSIKTGFSHVITIDKGIKENQWKDNTAKFFVYEAI